jgi:hypothetical protein
MEPLLPADCTTLKQFLFITILLSIAHTHLLLEDKLVELSVKLTAKL